MKHHHVGIAVASMDEGVKHARHLYLGRIARQVGPVYDPLQDAELCLFELEDGSHIELVAGKPAQAAISRGVNLHHICYEVPSVSEAVDEWYRRGALVVSHPKPAVLFDGRQVAFVLTPLGLVEFLSHA